MSLASKLSRGFRMGVMERSITGGIGLTQEFDHLITKFNWEFTIR